MEQDAPSGNIPLAMFFGSGQGTDIQVLGWLKKHVQGNTLTISKSRARSLSLVFSYTYVLGGIS